MPKECKYYIYGYSDYMKNVLYDILQKPEVKYYDLYVGKNIIEKIIHRVFVSRYSNLLSKLIMPVWYEKYLLNTSFEKKEIPILIMYEVNPLSNKIQWIKKMKETFPQIKFIYIFTNIITEHNKWRLNQINGTNSLYDLVVTFNKSDAEKYNLTHYEGIFSVKMPSEKIMLSAEMSDVYFCGLEKGRLDDIISVYEVLTQNNIKTNFNVIYAEKNKREYPDTIHYYDELLDNDTMLAGVINSKCVLELMVDRTQPGSSLRMCEAVAYGKKLLTNNKSASDKPFYNANQMSIFNNSEDIDIEFVKNDVDKALFENQEELSPVKFLDFIKENI